MQHGDQQDVVLFHTAYRQTVQTRFKRKGDKTTLAKRLMNKVVSKDLILKLKHLNAQQGGGMKESISDSRGHDWSVQFGCCSVMNSHWHQWDRRLLITDDSVKKAVQVKAWRHSYHGSAGLRNQDAGLLDMQNKRTANVALLSEARVAACQSLQRTPTPKFSNS